MPRLDIIEDQAYRRTIPKTIKMYRYQSNFVDLGSKLPSLAAFTSACTQAALRQTITREKKYHWRELAEADKVVHESMKSTLKKTKNIDIARVKSDIESKALMKAREESSHLFNKPLVSNMIKSRSTLATRKTAIK